MLRWLAFAAVAVLLVPASAPTDASAGVAGCGRGWRIAPSPNPDWSAILYGVVSFPSGTAWAVGMSHPVFKPSTVALHNDGSGWVQIATPNPDSVSNALRAVDGLADDDVWAVGTRQGGEDGTLVEHWDGAAWSVVPSPSPPHAFTSLDGVSVVSPTDAWAVGSSQDFSTGATSTLIEHWDGSSWAITPSPNPGATITELFGVSARSSTDAWAVGNFDGSDGRAYDLVLRWDGSSWSVIDAPSPGIRDNALTSTISLGPDDAWAVGYAADTTEETAKSPLTLHWDGKAWSSIPNPALSAQLDGVAAAPDGEVWAAGYLEEPASTLIERWDGSSWRVSPTEDHSGVLANYLNDIAVGSSEGATWGVGSSESGQGQWRTLVERPCAAS